MLSYFWTVYGFAIAYTFLSMANTKSFNVGALGIFDATYFSLTTAATVGYGDIVPISAAARSLVMAEIVLDLVYVVFFFSVLASAVRDMGANTVTKPQTLIGERRGDDGSPPESKPLD